MPEDTRPIFDKAMKSAIVNPDIDPLTNAIGGSYLHIRSIMSKNDPNPLHLTEDERRSIAANLKVCARDLRKRMRSVQPARHTEKVAVFFEPDDVHAASNAAMALRPSSLDVLISLFCAPDRAQRALQDLDMMWEAHWSVRFSPTVAGMISIKNAIGIILGGIAINVMKIGAVAAIVKAVKHTLGMLGV